MAELKDKELNEVNGGSLSDWAEKKKEQIEKWEKNSNNPVTPISDPLLPGEEGFYHDGKDVEAGWGRN